MSTVLVKVIGEGEGCIIELSIEEYNKILLLFRLAEHTQEYPDEVNNIINNAKVVEPGFVATINTGGDGWGIYNTDGNCCS